MLHAAWRDGLVVFGWRGRVLDRKTVTSFAATLFVDDDVRWATEELTLVPPGRSRPLEVTAVRVPVGVASQAFLVRHWVPWGSLSPSLAWCAKVARLADALAANAQVVPELVPLGDGAVARWRPVVGERTGTTLASLAEEMPAVVGALTPHAEPWQLTASVVEAFVDDAVRARLWDVAVSDPVPGSRVADAVVTRRTLVALTTPTGEVAARSAPERAAVQRISGDLARWSRGLTGRSPLADLVVSLRVVSPTDVEMDDDHPLADAPPEDLPWLVELGLVRADDPSLEVTAADVWEGKGARALDLPVEEVQAALRMAARRVAAMAPVLGDALDPKLPTQAELTLAELLVVLEREAPRLTAGGVRVLLPAWWGRRARARISARATPADRPVTSAGLEARTLAQVDWRMALGDDPLDEDDLARLASAKAPLVFLRGRWVAFDPEQVRRALTVLTAERRTRAVLGPIDLVRLGAEQGRDVEVTGDAWAGELLAGLPDERVRPVTEPSTFQGVLRPYQRRGLGWLVFLSRLGLGGCLADDMGLGKTAQLLALVAHDHAEGARGPTLVVCPLSVVRTWEMEAARFTPHLRVAVHHGAARVRADEAEAVADLAASDLVVTTYATAARDVAMLERITWQRVVADEAQHVKNAGTSAAKALRRIPAAQKLALTGTPVENRLGELWAICDLVNPGLLGSAKRFRDRFAVPIERHRDAEATAQLRVLVQPFLLRRSKADRALVPELPPKVEQVAWATLTREQASLYRSVTDVLLGRLDDLQGMDRRGAILAAITRLKQICNHPAQYLGDGSKLEGRSGKLTRVDELLDDALDAEGSVLLFTQYRVMGELLQRHLAHRLGLDVPFLHGGVAKARRDRMVERFQDGSGGPLLLVSLKAGGSGLNLTAASHVVHYDRWWNPAVEDQASDRAWRIGQRRTVVVHKLVCQGTIEERIDTLMAAKRDLAERVVGAGEAWLTELDTDELRELLVLREERR